MDTEKELARLDAVDAGFAKMLDEKFSKLYLRLRIIESRLGALESSVSELQNDND